MSKELEMHKHEMISLPQAAARLRMTWGSVYNAVLSGRLTGHLQGSRWLVSVESLESLARRLGLEDEK